MVKKLLIAFSVILTVAACRGGSGGPATPKYHPFPKAVAPAMVDDTGERLNYMARNYWTEYLSAPGVTDSAAIASVRTEDVELAFSTYLAILDMLPMADAKGHISDLFRAVETKQAEDTTSLFYLRFTELVSKYLYDPNSPVRNEDYYLPFVEGLAASRFTSEDVRPAYAFEAKMCAINQYGQQVSDFTFKDARGRIRNLYGIKADYTLLFFSNPGCESCQEIVGTLVDFPDLESWIADGSLAVVNIYIDQEIDKWREYEPNYPRSWITGYDHNYIIREDILFNVRAIPSLYLLDSDKRVLLKDAPTDRTLDMLFNKIRNR